MAVANRATRHKDTWSVVGWCFFSHKNDGMMFHLHVVDDCVFVVVRKKRQWCTITNASIIDAPLGYGSM